MPNHRDAARSLLDQLRDARGRRVVLVSHCLLNQNTRYAGGATCAGAVTAVVEELVSAGYGIHQLPCPERLAWGGVLKRHTLRLYHCEGRWRYRMRDLLLHAFVWWTRGVYRRLARSVARDVADYRRAGIEVAGFVGIGASPSCGVSTTLDLRASLEVVATCPAAALTRDVVNEQAVVGCRRSGRGLFVAALDRELRRRDEQVAAFEHDLAAELNGAAQAVLADGPRLSLGSRR
jgi:predicted secreted protein